MIEYKESNREKKLKPKRGLKWCWACDRDLVGDGEKCLTCGKKDHKRRLKNNKRNNMLG